MLGAVACALSLLVPALPATGQGSAAPRQVSGQAPSQTSVNLAPLLLPSGFGNGWKATAESSPAVPEPAFSLVEANKAALEEDGPQRSAVQNYGGEGTKTIHVEATEFKDVSGAIAAFSVLVQPGMHELKGLGAQAVEGGGGVLFRTGASVAVAFPASTADTPALKALAAVMPIAEGSQALQPLLPSLLPNRGLLSSSLRYALGPASYMAQGGVLPAAGLGWSQSLEAATAKYNDRRGAETLTLLLYPTPTIAGAHLRSVQGLLPGLGGSFRNAKIRREGSLVVLAEGTFSADAAQALVENTHLRQILSTDKAMPTPDVIETRKTFGLFANIIVFSMVLGGAAIVLGIFLGGGRALVRILQGKPAATEAEFLSLHLDPQNPAPVLLRGDPGKG